MVWTFRRPIYVGDDDASGLIYYPIYFHYMSQAEQDVFAELGFPMHTQIAAGLTLPVVSARCDYLAPTHAGDVLEHVVDVTAGERSSVSLMHEFRRQDGTVVARGTVVRAHTELATMKSLPLSEELRKALQAP